MKNKGQLKENCKVKICIADTSGNCVYSYNAIYRNGWFDHEGQNARHDTLDSIDGCYTWYIVDEDKKEPPMENFHCQPDKPLKKNFFNDSDCFPKTYQPEILAIPKPEVENIIYSLELGLENTQTVLAEHDASLGRTTKKNKSWAETLEGDIEFIKSSLAFLKEKLGTTNHQP